MYRYSPGPWCYRHLLYCSLRPVVLPLPPFALLQSPFFFLLHRHALYCSLRSVVLPPCALIVSGLWCYRNVLYCSLPSLVLLQAPARDATVMFSAAVSGP